MLAMKSALAKTIVATPIEAGVTIPPASVTSGKDKKRV